MASGKGNLYFILLVSKRGMVSMPETNITRYHYAPELHRKFPKVFETRDSADLHGLSHRHEALTSNPKLYRHHIYESHIARIATLSQIETRGQTKVIVTVSYH
jgi:hypothetical protein